MSILDRLALLGLIIPSGTKQNTLLQYTPLHTATLVQYTSHYTHPHTMSHKVVYQFLAAFTVSLGLSADMFSITYSSLL